MFGITKINGGFSINRLSLWAFTRVRVEDDYDYDDEGERFFHSYRTVVVHWLRLHITFEWRRT